jgi:hypothetical protein
MEDIFPVLARIPCDFAGGIDLDRHNLADLTALDDDDCCANATALAATVFASSDIFTHEGVAIGHICSRNNVR